MQRFLVTMHNKTESTFKLNQTVLVEPPHDVLKIFAIKSLGTRLQINDSRLSKEELVSVHLLKGLRKFPYKTLQKFPLLDRKCPFCAIRLSACEFVEENEDEEGWYPPEPIIGRIEYCMNCQYWRWHHLDTYQILRDGFHEIHEYKSHVSKIRQFEETLPDEFSKEISQWLRRNPYLYHELNPRRFEKLVADIFKANYEDAEVMHVGKPDDGGVDVLFIDVEKRQWLIQVKRRENPNSSEPVETIRNLLGTMVLENSSYGMVVSTADHFTYRAYAAVNRARERGLILKLIDRGKLNRMLDPMLPDRPWLNLLKKQYPNLAEYFESNTKSKKQIEDDKCYRQLKLRLF